MVFIISVGKCQNQVSKRLKRSHSNIGYHWRMFYKEHGKFKSRRISASKARFLKIKLKIVKNKAEIDEIRLIRCDKCDSIQEDLGQKVCENCHI